MGEILRGVLAPSILEGAKSQKFLYTLEPLRALRFAQILAPESVRVALGADFES